MDDWKTAEMDESRRAMLRYAEKLTRAPSKIRRSDVISLRELGFTDTDLLHINQVVSYFNFVNRLADGLGVELEEEAGSERGS